MAGTTTAQNIFDAAMYLIDEVSSAGLTDTSDTADYKNRTLGILNLLQIETYPLSDTYAIVTAGTRPIPAVIASFTAAITAIDDIIARGVLPYGLAGKLLAGEGDEKGNYFLAVYEELKKKFASAPAEFTDIEQAYGGIEYGEAYLW